MSRLKCACGDGEGATAVLFVHPANLHEQQLQTKVVGGKRRWAGVGAVWQRRNDEQWAACFEDGMARGIGREGHQEIK